MSRICARLLLAIVFTPAFALAQRGGPIPQQLTFKPDRSSGIYNIGETVGWTVTPGPAVPTYAYTHKWMIRRNNADVLKQGKVDLSSGRARIEITGDAPEMIYIAIEPMVKLANVPAAAPALCNPNGYVGGNARSKEVLGILLKGGAFQPNEVR
jgi:hypothetical protein